MKAPIMTNLDRRKAFLLDYARKAQAHKNRRRATVGRAAVPRFKWDRGANAGYLTVADGSVAQTKEVAPGIMLDLDRLGNVLGVEVLR